MVCMCTSGAPQPDVHANSGSDGVVVVAVGVVVLPMVVVGTTIILPNITAVCCGQ